MERAGGTRGGTRCGCKNKDIWFFTHPRGRPGGTLARNPRFSMLCRGGTPCVDVKTEIWCSRTIGLLSFRDRSLFLPRSVFVPFKIGLPLRHPPLSGAAEGCTYFVPEDGKKNSKKNSLGGSRNVREFFFISFPDISRKRAHAWGTRTNHLAPFQDVAPGGWHPVWM